MLPVFRARIAKDKELPADACVALALLTRLITGVKTGVLMVPDNAMPLNVPAVKDALARLLS
ncbi:hypothetical protein D3C80_2022500 [compost metagenome]